MNENPSGNVVRVIRKKRQKVLIIVSAFVVLYIYHYANTLQEFYKIPYEKVDISDIIRNENISEDDFNEVFRQTGISPAAAKELIKNKKCC